MYFFRRNLFKKFFIISLFSFFIIFSRNTLSYNILEITLNDSCKCYKDFKFRVKTLSSKYIIEFENRTLELNSEPLLTCDLVKSLKRGTNQKVISYSLYGKNPRYYKLLKELVIKVKEFYPDYVMRVYHDDSVKKSLICETECSNSHVEFCNIHKIPRRLTDKQKVLNIDYVHAMMWRFLPIGDSFVDLFMSRDMDSELLQREVDSVNVWIKSDKIGHIMRDHPSHIYYILGGMWGLKVSQARKLGRDLFEKIIDVNVTSKYNPNLIHKRGYDQDFLADFAYGKLRPRSIIHDSFLCNNFSDSNPWPTQRIGDCFVGIIGKCNPKAKFKVCPNSCRPIDHKNWTSC